MNNRTVNRLIKQKSTDEDEQFTFGKVQFEKFDRKTFNPEKNDFDLNILYKLRSRGWNRRIVYKDAKSRNFPDIRPDKFWKAQSTALWYMRMQFEKLGIGSDESGSYKGKIFCDFGCGQSPDVLIALDLGFKKSIAVDLFKVREEWPSGCQFIQADICEKLPIKDNSVDQAICQAVLDLMTVEDRILFYKNAFKALKPGGSLAIYIIKLAPGYGFNLLREMENAMDVGFYLERKFIDGFLLKK